MGLELLALMSLIGCQDARRAGVQIFDKGYTPAIAADALEARWTGDDLKRQRAAIRLTPVAEGLSQPVDFTFVGDTLLVAEKTGALKWVSLADGTSGTLISLEVLTVSEQGLLGVALHPKFAENGRLFLNFTIESEGEEVSRVQEWTLSDPGNPRASTAVAGTVVMEVTQPYQNHNAGDLAFGPDGMLYIGWGDGGFRFDPHGNGQDRSTLLGAMLRVDIDGDAGSRPENAGYSVPSDNPFAGELVGQEGIRPEIWAWGLRNPWRYTFAPDGRLLIADVGQDLYEEISVASKGDNLGWNLKEGAHCYEAGASEAPADCEDAGLTPPIYEYARADGQSITGGEVVTDTAIPALTGRYVFGDFISGRLWALALPDRGPADDPLALGQWPLLISSFARDTSGKVYIGAYGKGAIFRIDPDE